MSTPAPLDFLIIGQGLAGSLLAWTLIQHGQRIMVLEDHHRTSSSIAAAGLINPVTGQRLVKGAEVDTCLATAHHCYRTLERRFAHPLLHEVAMQRLVTNPAMLDHFDKRRADPDYRDYLGDYSPRGESGWPLNDPFGSFRQLHTGYLAVATLLARIQQELIARQAYRAERIDPAALQLSAEGVSWKTLHAKRVVFCEGYLARDNPWFSWLPFQPVKGEILTIASAVPLPEVIINGGHWLLPLADGHHKLGATYDREQLDESATPEARQALLKVLPELLASEVTCQVLEHRAGVRPGTRDKQPFLGFHPRHPQLAIFNGFGSRGSLLIPWHAQLFAEVLLGHAALPSALDIRRHWNKT